MVPIQQTIKEFESKLLTSVQESLNICFQLPNTFITEDKLTQIRQSLTKAVDTNWESFTTANKSIFVDEEKPEKNYLEIGYACKNDPLVMTLHKGQLERRTGVLSTKYSMKFFVLTECKTQVLFCIILLILL